MDILQSKGKRFNNTSSTPSGGSAVVTESASTNHIHYVTEIGGSSVNATAQIRLYSNSTEYWTARLGSSAYEKVFRVPIAITSGSAVSVEVLSGGGSAYVNMAGYTI